MVRANEQEREDVGSIDRGEGYLATNMMTSEKSLVAVHLADMSP
jgi:hypothetical protein